MRAVITGATGAIGMALIELLEKNKIETLVLCRNASARASRIKESEYIKKIDCPLDKMSEFSIDCDRRYDVFFHLAWAGTIGDSRNDMYLQNDNVRYTLDAVQLAARLGCHTFVGAGSQAEYGRFEGVLTPDTPPFPENGYGIAKLCAGQMSRELATKLGIKHIWARILSVYGPYDGEMTMVGSTLRKLLSGETPKFTAGEQIWDYMYSKDAAGALLALAENGRDREVYCLGGGSSRMLKEYICLIRDAVDKNAKLGIGEIPYAPCQVMKLEVDISKLSEHTGFVPKYSFEEGIAQTVEWFKKFSVGNEKGVE